MMEALSRVWRVYVLGCKCFYVVADHASLVYLLKQSSDELIDSKTYRDEKVMSYANLMRILCKKGIIYEVNLVSRRTHLLPIDKIYKPNESLWLDFVPDIDTN